MKSAIKRPLAQAIAAALFATVAAAPSWAAATVVLTFGGGHVVSP